MAQTGLSRLIKVAPNFQWVSLSTIKLDAGTQVRFEIDSQAVNRYAKLMVSDLWNWNYAIDPIVLFVSPEGIFPGDGHHRIIAAQQAFIPLVYAEVRTGSLLEAQLYALQANTNHGLQLTPKDTRTRVTKLLDLDVCTGDENCSVEEILEFLKLPKSCQKTVNKIWHQQEVVC